MFDNTKCVKCIVTIIEKHMDPHIVFIPKKNNKIFDENNTLNQINNEQFLKIVI